MSITLTDEQLEELRDSIGELAEDSYDVNKDNLDKRAYNIGLFRHICGVLGIGEAANDETNDTD